MAIKAILTDLSEAPEALRGEYAQKELGGKTVYVLDVEGVDDHPAVANLKNAYERVKSDKQSLASELREAKAKASAIPEGFDADEWERLRSEEEARKADPSGKDVRAQIDAATAALKTQYETRITRLSKDAEAKLSEKEKELSALDAEIRGRLVGDGLRQTFVALGVKRGLVDAAIARFERDVEVVVEDGKRVARMKPELGGGEVPAYFQNWANGDDAKDFIDPARGGDESGSRSPSGAGENPFGKKAWSKTAQATVLRADRGKAERLAKAAGFRSLDAALAASAPND